MTLNETLMPLLTAAATALMGLAAVWVQQIARKLRARLDGAAIRDAMEEVRAAARTAVASAHQTTVGPLKDPSKAGQWTAAAALAARDAATRDVAAAVPWALDLLRAHRVDVERWLDRVIEAEVLDLKSRLLVDIDHILAGPAPRPVTLSPPGMPTEAR